VAAAIGRRRGPQRSTTLAALAPRLVVKPDARVVLEAQTVGVCVKGAERERGVAWDLVVEGPCGAVFERDVAEGAGAVGPICGEGAAGVDACVCEVDVEGEDDEIGWGEAAGYVLEDDFGALDDDGEVFWGILGGVERIVGAWDGEG